MEWKEKCAIALCRDETQGELGAFIRSRASAVLPANLREELPKEFMPNGLPSLDIHEFELYMHQVSAQSGTRWKDWLFEKARWGTVEVDVLSTLQALATMCIKSSVRRGILQEWGSLDARLREKERERMRRQAQAKTHGKEVLSRSLAEDVSEEDGVPLEELLDPGKAVIVSEESDRSSVRPIVTSLDAPVGEGGEASRRDVFDPAKQGAESVGGEFADSGGALADQELDEVSRDICSRHFVSMDFVERVAMLACLLGLSLSHAEVTAVAGLKKSMVNAAFVASNARLRAAVQREFDGESARTWSVVRLHTLRSLQEKIMQWAFSEKSVQRLFSLAEKRSSHA
jgi:hypothetical protein